MSKKVTVAKLPKCDFCYRDAKYDFKTNMGPWANGCEDHYIFHRHYDALGTGKGQELVLKEAGK